MEDEHAYMNERLCICIYVYGLTWSVHIPEAVRDSGITASLTGLRRSRVSGIILAKSKRERHEKRAAPTRYPRLVRARETASYSDEMPPPQSGCTKVVDQISMLASSKFCFTRRFGALSNCREKPEADPARKIVVSVRSIPM